MLKLKKKVTEWARNIAWWYIFSLAILNALDSVPSIKEGWDSSRPIKSNFVNLS